MSDGVPALDDSLIPDEEPSSLSEIQLTEAHMRYAMQRWPDVTPKMRQYRMRQAIWAKFQHMKPHPDDPGRKMLGGPQPNSGRKPVKAIGTAIVEHFEARQKEVLDAIGSALDPTVDPAIRHKAGMNIAKHAREEAREQRDADEYARSTDDDIRRQFAKMLADAVAAGEITVEDIIEGSATEILDESRQIAS